MARILLYGDDTGEISSISLRGAIVKSPGQVGEDRERRRDLLRQYARLQRELIEGDPGASAYQATIQAFRQLGYTLIAHGYDEDLDRLLRIRVLDGGRATPRPRQERAMPELLVIEQRQIM